MQQSITSVRGQTVIPKEIRDELGIKPGTRLAWSIRDGIAVVTPVPDDPIAASYGMLKGRGPTTKDLLEERRADLESERKKHRRWLKEVNRSK